MVVPENPRKLYGPMWLHASPSPSTASSPTISAVDASIASGDLRQLLPVRNEPTMVRDFQTKSARMAKPVMRCRCMAAIQSGLEWVRPR